MRAISGGPGHTILLMSKYSVMRLSPGLVVSAEAAFF